VDIIVTKEPSYKFVPPGALRNEKYEHFDQKGQLQKRGSKGAGSKIRKDVGNGAVLLVLSGCFSFNIGRMSMLSGNAEWRSVYVSERCLFRN
jgi:hypothetical protein